MHFHFFKLLDSRVEIVCGHTCINHTVVQNLVRQLRVLDVFKHLSDQSKLFALVSVDHSLDQARLGEVVGLDLLVQHLSLAFPCAPEVFAAHLSVDDGILTHSAWTDIGFAHQLRYCLEFSKHFVLAAAVQQSVEHYFFRIKFHLDHFSEQRKCFFDAALFGETFNDQGVSGFVCAIVAHLPLEFEDLEFGLLVQKCFYHDLCKVSFHLPFTQE